MINALLPVDFNLVTPYQLRKIAFSGDLSTALTFNGELYHWGGSQANTLPGLLKPEPILSKPTSIEQSLSKCVTIPTSLFKDVKVVGASILGVDVDNALWHYHHSTKEEEAKVLKPLITLETEEPFPPSRIRDVYIDPQSASILVMLAAENTEQ